MPVAPVDTYALGGLQSAFNRDASDTLAFRVQPGLTKLPAGAVMSESTVTANAGHTLAANGATAGTFTLTFRGYTTTVLNFNDTAATVAAALNALPSIPGGAQ